VTKDRKSHIEAREKRMKEALRANLQRRKQKSRALRSDEKPSLSKNGEAAAPKES
jgi:hypothetical protein